MPYSSFITFINCQRWDYGLYPFDMKVQGLDRTFVDKVFAICDYYLQDNINKHSRHLYDVYGTLTLVNQ